jgi:hypothetical protein
MEDAVLEDITKGMQAIVTTIRSKSPEAVVIVTGIFPAVMPIIDKSTAISKRWRKPGRRAETYLGNLEPAELGRTWTADVWEPLTEWLDGMASGGVGLTIPFAIFPPVPGPLSPTKPCWI